MALQREASTPSFFIFHCVAAKRLGGDRIRRVSVNEDVTVVTSRSEEPDKRTEEGREDNERRSTERKNDRRK